MIAKRAPFLAIAISLALAACGSPESRVYQLPSPPPPAGAAPGNTIVFVDAVTVAEYADRPEMVTRVEGIRLNYAEFDVWGQPIGTMITRFLVDALGNRFGPANVMETPAGAPFEPDFQVLVDIRKLEANDQGEAVLDAQWQIFETGNLETARLGRASFSEAIGAGRAEDAPEPSEPEDLRVQSFANLLDRLAGEIAADLQG